MTGQRRPQIVLGRACFMVKTRGDMRRNMYHLPRRSHAACCGTKPSNKQRARLPSCRPRCAAASVGRVRRSECRMTLERELRVPLRPASMINGFALHARLHPALRAVARRFVDGPLVRTRPRQQNAARARIDGVDVRLLGCADVGRA